MADGTGGGEACPRVTALIVTRNRREELMRAIASVAEQTLPTEIVIVDDCSSDGTPEAVQEAYPEAKVLRSERHLGYIAQRNRGIGEATAPLILGLDDDAELISPRTLEVGAACFDGPRVAVVALPMINIGEEYVVRNRAPDGERSYVTDVFPGGASLLRRDVLIDMDGFREQAYRGEDSEYARRLLARGWVVRIGTAPEVHHHVSVNRDRRADVFDQAHAQVLGTAWALRARDLPFRALLSVGYGVRHGSPWAAVRGIAAGAVDSWRLRALREPLSPELIALNRRMARERARLRYSLTVADLEPHLPPVRELGTGVAA